MGPGFRILCAVQSECLLTVYRRLCTGWCCECRFHPGPDPGVAGAGEAAAAAAADRRGGCAAAGGTSGVPGSRPTCRPRPPAGPLRAGGHPPGHRRADPAGPAHPTRRRLPNRPGTAAPEQTGTVAPEQISTEAPEQTSSTAAPEQASTAAPEQISTAAPEQASTVAPEQTGTEAPKETSTASPDQSSAAAPQQTSQTTESERTNRAAVLEQSGSTTPGDHPQPTGAIPKEPTRVTGVSYSGCAAGQAGGTGGVG